MLPKYKWYKCRLVVSYLIFVVALLFEFLAPPRSNFYVREWDWKMHMRKARHPPSRFTPIRWMANAILLRNDIRIKVTSTLPMGFPPWLPPAQTDDKIIVWSYRSIGPKTAEKKRAKHTSNSNYSKIQVIMYYAQLISLNNARFFSFGLQTRKSESTYTLYPAADYTWTPVLYRLKSTWQLSIIRGITSVMQSRKQLY